MASEIVLLNVSGEDQPGLLAMLTSRLAEYQVRVLNIGQAVIHDELNVGMLVQIADGADTRSVIGDLEHKAAILGISIRSTPISAADYQEWVGSQGEPRYIVTLVSVELAPARIPVLVGDEQSGSG